jgi:hypothetical protein
VYNEGRVRIAHKAEEEESLLELIDSRVAHVEEVLHVLLRVADGILWIKLQIVVAR